MRFLLPLLFLAAPAHAACQGDEAFSCKIGAKTLDVCYWKGMLTYRFGPEGKPELILNEPLETVAFTPWPGMGSSFWETVAFRNGDYTYEVWTSVERDPEATEPRQGGVRVLQGEQTVAELTCDPDTVSPMDTLYDLKHGIGQCWDVETQVWGPCP
ncbi:MAG: hypothetical protein MUE52_18025 [Tabrizicola sp.]|nr:hypothetical protein [Tabrizicola sp.]